MCKFTCQQTCPIYGISMNSSRRYFTTLLFLLFVLKDGLTKPFSDPTVASQSEVPAINDSKEESYPDAVSKEAERKLPILPFLPSEEKQSSTSPSLALNLFNLSSLDGSSSRPIMYLGSFQLMSMPMPNMGDIMGMIGNLPSFNFPNLGNTLTSSESTSS